MTFLPYHAHSIFPTVLSILPRNLPQILRFLYPYIQSLSCPPRHAVVYSFSHNQGLFSFFCSYVLNASRLGLQYPALLSFWASTTTEATALMLDQARSGRREAQLQYQEDIIMRIMPILNEGLSIDGIADLRVGCYMILTVLSSKATFNDDAWESIMDAVVLGWDETSHAGLICLAVMAQKKQLTILPASVYKALINLENLKDDLSVLRRRYHVDKLTLGVVFGMVDELHKLVTGEVAGKPMRNSSSDLIDHMCTLFEADFLTRPSVVKAIERMLPLSIEAPSQPQTHNLPKLVTDIIIRLAASEIIGDTVRETVQHFSSTHEGLLQGSQVLEFAVRPSQEVNDDDEFPSVSIDLDKESFDAVVSRIESHTGDATSFLSHSEPVVFSAMADAFVGALESPSDLSIFQDLPVLRKPLAMTEPFFLPFFVRIWCGFCSPQARTTAIETVSSYLAQQDLVSDVQILLPYLLYALLDSSRKVRQASGKLVLLLATKYRGLKDSKKRNSSIRVILGQDQIYGAIKQDEQLLWLRFDEVVKLLNDFLVPNLEESLLDARHFSERLALSLNGGSQTPRPSNAKDLKTSLRQAIFAFLCNHVTHTPLKSVQLRLLPVLNRITKVGNLTRARALMPLYIKSVEKNEVEFQNECNKSHIDADQLVKELTEILSPTDRDSVNALKNAIRAGMRSEAHLLNSAAYRRIRHIWSSLNMASQSNLAETLLELSVMEADLGSATAEQSDAADTLQSVELSSHTLIALLERLPHLIGELEDKSSAPKKRRTDLGQHSVRAATPQALKYALRTITFVLELISTCKPERYPELLSGLFQLLIELKSYRNLSGSEPGYLEVITLVNASAIIDNSQVCSTRENRSIPFYADIDRRSLLGSLTIQP